MQSAYAEKTVVEQIYYQILEIADCGEFNAT